MKKYTVIGIVVFVLLVGIFSITQNQSEIEDSKRDETVLILEDKVIEDVDSILIEDNNVYLPLEFIQEHFDDSIYTDEDGKKAFIDVSNKNFQMEDDDITKFVKESNANINIPLMIKDYTKYLPIDQLEKVFSIDVNYNEESNIVIIDRFGDESKFSEIKYDNVNIYSKESLRGHKVDIVNNGNVVKILSEEEKSYRVRTEKGYYGYVEKKFTDGEPKQIEFDYKINSTRENQLDDGKINVTWEYVYEKTPDISDEEKIEGLDVVTPTWFSLDNEGVITNKADFDYVEEAHEKGYKVWGLVDNSFDPKLTSEVINNDEMKDKVIAQIAFYASLYDLDGINIDFENVYYEDRDALTEFVEDLTHILKKQNLVVSIDVTVPSGSERWSKVYDRERLSQIVDYVALMAYDEHWATSPVSGSVASIGWVERGIERSLDTIPKEKLLLGVPFYTRVWKETKDENGKIKVSSKAVPIRNVEEILDRNNAAISWDEETGQYFATYEEDGAVYKVWVEDTESIKLKLELANKYSLKGIASWRKGYEYDEVWEVINNAVDDKDLL
ncbi:glycosyl hydrolase family 18 protein [Wukongibacter baidiensis]|uniref:glycosyl hydrolase family 18 protein n=1 Tax=Wukongibacter baidiensis TaxID=1723361 RepID=UPI003D7FDD7A